MLSNKRSVPSDTAPKKPFRSSTFYISGALAAGSVDYQPTSGLMQLVLLDMKLSFVKKDFLNQSRTLNTLLLTIEDGINALGRELSSPLTSDVAKKELSTKGEIIRDQAGRYSAAAAKVNQTVGAETSQLMKETQAELIHVSKQVKENPTVLSNAIRQSLNQKLVKLTNLVKKYYSETAPVIANNRDVCRDLEKASPAIKLPNNLSNPETPTLS